MPISPTAPMPLHNQPTLHIIGNPAGNISGNTSGNIVHLLTLRSLSHNSLATLHPIGKTGNIAGNISGNISGNKIGNNSGNTACIITMARTASATAPIPEKFTTRANQTSPSATPAAPPAMIPAIESATIPATSAPTYRHPIRPTTVYLRGLRGTRWRDFNRPPYAGNISGKDSGNASANHPPLLSPHTTITARLARVKNENIRIFDGNISASPQ
jgi:hypothetical protein